MEDERKEASLPLKGEPLFHYCKLPRFVFELPPIRWSSHCYDFFELLEAKSLVKCFDASRASSNGRLAILTRKCCFLDAASLLWLRKDHLLPLCSWSHDGCRARSIGFMRDSNADDHKSVDKYKRVAYTKKEEAKRGSRMLLNIVF
ncbi:hypothetical protein BDZ45DRAFT_273043 [Acephala macrosclerotiorum]|nr:hypothetical protein BDZ45DRAFT_273043 [Acephala macrosclerotiorum]